MHLGLKISKKKKKNTPLAWNSSLETESIWNVSPLHYLSRKATFIYIILLLHNLHFCILFILLLIIINKLFIYKFINISQL